MCVVQPERCLKNVFWVHILIHQIWKIKISSSPERPEALAILGLCLHVATIGRDEVRWLLRPGHLSSMSSVPPPPHTQEGLCS